MKYEANVLVNNQNFTIELKEWESLFVNKKYIHDSIVNMFGKVSYKAIAKLPSFKGLLEMDHNESTFNKCELIKSK